MTANAGYHFTPTQARTVLLAAQGLIQPPAVATKEDVLAAIRQMCLLQIDTINVINRSPYLVLWSRVGAFPLNWLTDLLEERAIFEYWSHAACFIPMEDYALHRRVMLENRTTWRNTTEWIAEHPEIVERVMAVVQKNGGARSSDFERSDDRKGSWWNWKEEKIALELLFITGELMIAKRVNFQRVYDLRERIVSAWDDQNAPAWETVQRELILRSVKALGTAHLDWIADYFRMAKRNIAGLVRKLADEGLLLPVTVAGWDGPIYVSAEQPGTIKDILNGKLKPTRTVLLSPFDPVIWDRARLLKAFGFEYQIEVYTPGPKRKYGYFTLPILHGDRIVGRLDPKAHRKEKILEIRAIHLEPEILITDELVNNLSATLQDFAVWHGLDEVVIRPVGSTALANLLTGMQGKLTATK